jgi:hypothetical protein
MRAACALLRLCDKYGDGHVEAVCHHTVFPIVAGATMTERSPRGTFNP